MGLRMLKVSQEGYGAQVRDGSTSARVLPTLQQPVLVFRQCLWLFRTLWAFSKLTKENSLCSQHCDIRQLSTSLLTLIMGLTV